VGVDMISFLRAEQKFDGLDALKAQIARDCQAARTVLASPAGAPGRFAPAGRETSTAPGVS
jgi:riboflavin kinase/FMN adenylyltransferase